MTMWTQFWDMHSGGRSKEKYEKIYIEAPKDEAKVIFYNRFGHNPERVSCTCCGEDYSIGENESLDQMTAFHRNCGWDEQNKKWGEFRDPKLDGYGYKKGQRPYLTPAEYAKQPDILIIPSSEIKDSERLGEVPEQGYVSR